MKKLLSTIWHAGYPILISAAVNLFCTYAAVIFFAGVFYKDTGMMSIDIASGIIDQNILLLTGIVSLMIIPLYMFLIQRDSKRTEPVTATAKINVHTIIICIAGACGTALAMTLYLRILNILMPERTIEQYAAVFHDSAPIVMIIVTIILGPLCEELLYRGLVFKRIERSYGFIIGALISSAAYAISKGSIYQGVYGFLLGMLLSLAFEKTGKIWIPSVMHMTAATVVLVLDSLSDVLVSYSGRIQLAAAIAGMIVGIAAAAISLYFLIRKEKEKSAASPLREA